MELNFYPKGKQYKGYLRCLFVALLLSFNLCAAQEIRVTGQVTSSEDVNGIPGVNVVVKGTQTGTITDATGRYSVSVADANAVLIFSSIGFNTREVPVGGRSVIDVS